MLGFRVRFELLKQVKFPGPKFTDNCGMNTFTNMALKTRTWCYSFDQYVRKCNDRLVVNMINKITMCFRTEWHLLCYCCRVKHPAHRSSKSRVYPLRCLDSGSPPRSYAADAGDGVCCWCCSPVLLLLWFGNTYAHKSCTSDLRVQGIHTMSKETPSRLRSKQALTSTVSQCQSTDSEKHNHLHTLTRGFTATLARCWAALYGVGCPSVRAAKSVPLRVSRATLSACFFHVSATAAITAAAAANSRRLS